MDVFLSRQKFLGKKKKNKKQKTKNQKKKQPAKIFQLALAVNMERRHDVFRS